MEKKSEKVTVPPTTAQQLASLVKSARDIMRKDKGLNGDLDRLPMLTWVMFLKFLDDMEQLQETEVKLAGKRYRSAIDPPYRWRDWAIKEDGITGDELISFVNNEEAMRPDGKKGPGLFKYLRSLQGANGGDRRDVIATVFKGTVNRMINGYLLRDVINKVNGIHFTSSEEIHTLGNLYESMLKEMRDAAGDSGEFYTPRPVVRFMVDVTNPRLGETMLDPACGTGGFLVESYLHLEKQCKRVEDRHVLQRQSLFGGEAKSLPYLLVQMNLLLHGLESPQIDPGNSLRFPLKEIGDKDRVDIILTNPPFGGEEEKGVLSNFPEDKQTSETALLFLQLIMRKLRRQPKPGRAAVVLPDGILSQEGIAIRIREELVTKYNLHTVVRLPRGVFEPYTKSSTSILFFDTRQPAKQVWFYEVTTRPTIKAYTQNQPFLFEELTPCINWWNQRKENDHAWTIPISTLSEHNYSLSQKNPRTLSSGQFSEPQEILRDVIEGLQRIDGVKARLTKIWGELSSLERSNQWPTEVFSTLAMQVKREHKVEATNEYSILAMSWYAKGLYVKHKKAGAGIKGSKLYKVQSGDFVYNRLFAWKGSFAEATDENDGCYVSNEFPCFQVNREVVVPGYLWAYFAQRGLWSYIESLSTGTTSTSRLRLKEARLKKFRIPIPPRPIQEKLATVWQDALKLEHEIDTIGELLTSVAPAVIERLIPFHSDE